jgi:hypothetical protein
VTLRRLRTGERIALASAVALVVLLALDWFFLSTPDARIGAHESGIRALGWFAELLIIVAILLTFAVVFFTVTQRAVAIPVTFTVFAVLFAIAATVAIVLRVLLFQPTLGVDATARDVDVELPAILGLVASAALTLGLWIVLADERTDTPESLDQTDDVLRVRGAPRPAPPRHAPDG